MTLDIFGYYFRRIVIFAFILLGGWTLCTLFMDNYYCYEYHDVEIVSDYKKTVRNPACTTREHADYYIDKRFVKFMGKLDPGTKTVEVEVELDMSDASDASDYNDIKQGTYTDYTSRGFATWITLLCLFFLSLICFAFECECSYYEYDRKCISKCNLWIWKCLATFCGKDPELINKVCEDYDDYLANGKYQNRFSISQAYSVMEYWEVYDCVKTEMENEKKRTQQ